MISMLFRVYILVGVCLLTGASAVAQHFVTKEGAFMDTATAGIDIHGLNYYYSVGGKYPRASSTLLQEARAFADQKNGHYTGSGYITFRFVIDTTGHMLKKVQVIQTDVYYKDHHFDKALVEELFAYLQTLHEWKIARYKNEMVFPYRTIMTFKIKDGKVINIIP